MLWWSLRSNSEFVVREWHVSAQFVAGLTESYYYLLSAWDDRAGLLLIVVTTVRVKTAPRTADWPAKWPFLYFGRSPCFSSRDHWLSSSPAWPMCSLASSVGRWIALSRGIGVICCRWWTRRGRTTTWWRRSCGLSILLRKRFSPSRRSDKHASTGAYTLTYIPVQRTYFPKLILGWVVNRFTTAQNYPTLKSSSVSRKKMVVVLKGLRY